MTLFDYSSGNPKYYEYEYEICHVLTIPAQIKLGHHKHKREMDSTISYDLEGGQNE